MEFPKKEGVWSASHTPPVKIKLAVFFFILPVRSYFCKSPFISIVCLSICHPRGTRNINMYSSYTQDTDDESPRFRQLLRVMDPYVVFESPFPTPTPSPFESLTSDSFTTMGDGVEIINDDFGEGDLKEVNFGQDGFEVEAKIEYKINWKEGMLVDFVCPIAQCSRHYLRKGDLKVHLNDYHENINLANLLGSKSSRENKPFGCPIEECNCGYRWERDLKRHLKQKHQAFFAENFNESGLLRVHNTRGVYPYKRELKSIFFTKGKTALNKDD